MSDYKVKFYISSRNGKEPVLGYIQRLDDKNRAKVLRFIEFLREHQGYLDEPYTKHVIGKIRELRIDFARNHHRIFYFTFVGQTIILLHAFLKKKNKIPKQEIEKAQENYQDVINNPRFYE